jgi:hypothetical protein
MWPIGEPSDRPAAAARSFFVSELASSSRVREPAGPVERQFCAGISGRLIIADALRRSLFTRIAGEFGNNLVE